MRSGRNPTFTHSAQTETPSKLKETRRMLELKCGKLFEMMEVEKDEEEEEEEEEEDKEVSPVVSKRRALKDAAAVGFLPFVPEVPSSSSFSGSQQAFMRDGER